MSIGDFARATHLGVKALRHYHEEGLLEPAEVDPFSGYRRYDGDSSRWRTEIGWPIFETAAR